MQDETTGQPNEVQRSESMQPQRRQGAGARGVITWVFVVLASAGVVFTALAFWLHEELFDSGRVVETVRPILSDPAVTTSLSARVSAQLVDALDIRGRAQQALPERATFLATAIASAAQEFVRRQLESLFNDPRFQEAVLAAIRFAHETIVRILRGQSDVILVEDGVVTLNLVPLVDAGLRRIEASGLLPPGITLPTLTGTEAPSAARQQLSQAIGTRLPADFGEIQLFESAELERAQRAVQVFDRLTVVLPIVTALFIGAALVISPHRRRTVVQLALGAVIALLLARLVLRLISRSVVAAAEENPTSGAVVSAAVGTLMDSLLGFTNLLVVAGIIVALVAFLLGRPRWLTDGWQRIRGLAGRGPSGTTVVGWVDQHIDMLRIAGVVVAVAALFLVPLNWAVFLIGVALLIGYQVLLSVVQRRAPPPPAGAPPGGETAST
jgi:hypothetical protein